MPFKPNWKGLESDRFWSRVVIADSGCWEWQGALDGKGYGAFTPARRETGKPAKQVTAYSWAYTHYVGPVEAGKHLHHKCENILCVNPFHLEQLTPKEHVAKSQHNPCCGNSKKEQCKHGHLFNEQNTRLVNGKRRCKTCERISSNKPSYRIYMRNYMREYMRKIRHEQKQTKQKKGSK